MTVVRGVVKWFEPAHEKGYIIASVNGKEQDVAVYRTDIVDERYENLVPHERVELEIATGPGGRAKARNVRSLIQPDGRERGVVLDFGHLRGNGHIQPDDGGEPVSVKKHDIIGEAMRERTLDAGERVEYRKQPESSGAVCARNVKRLHATTRLYRWADMGKETEWLTKLAKKAEEEDGHWNYFRNPKDTLYPVLKSYLTYTFKQLEDECAYGVPTIASNGNLAAFHTGLETKYHSPIYATFEPADINPPAISDYHRPEWKLKDFFHESETFFHKAFGGNVPQRATYFTDPSVLVFHADWPVLVDKEHIADKNLKRFPDYVHKGKDRLEAINGAISYLDSMWTQTRRRVERNYKVAVPQYYCGAVQLLLPLCLLDGQSADLALVLSQCTDEFGHEYYDAGTALTLDQAYNNARLLTRPDKDWLKP